MRGVTGYRQSRRRLRLLGAFFGFPAACLELGRLGAGNKWHAYTVIYRDREIVIVDSENRGPTGVKRRVREFDGMWLARELLAVMSKRQTEKVGGESCWGRIGFELGIPGLGNRARSSV